MCGGFGAFSFRLTPETKRGAPLHHTGLLVVSVGADGVLAFPELLLDLERPSAVAADHQVSNRLLVIEEEHMHIGYADAGHRDLPAIGAGILIVELANFDGRLRPLRRRSILVGNHRLRLAWDGLRRLGLLLGLWRLRCRGLRRRLLFRSGRSGFLRRFLRGRFLLRDLLARLADSNLDRLLAGQRLRPIRRGGAQLKRIGPRRAEACRARRSRRPPHRPSSRRSWFRRSPR